MAQRSVCAPFLRELYCSAREEAMVLLQLVLEARKKRKRVRRATGESGDNLVVVEAPGLFRVVLNHAFAESHLPITRQRNFVVLADTQHRCAAYRSSLGPHGHPAIILRSAPNRRTPQRLGTGLRVVRGGRK